MRVTSLLVAVGSALSIHASAQAACAQISARNDGWTYVGSFYSTSLSGSVSSYGSWTVDSQNCGYIGPYGNVPGNNGYCPRLNGFLQYRFDSRYAMGELLTQVNPTGGNYYEIGYGELQNLTVNSSFTLYARINDTGMGDNDGSITLCINQ